jgi:hypothetical protein
MRYTAAAYAENVSAINADVARIIASKIFCGEEGHWPSPDLAEGLALAQLELTMQAYHSYRRRHARAADLQSRISF